MRGQATGAEAVFLGPFPALKSRLSPFMYPRLSILPASEVTAGGKPRLQPKQ